MSSTRLLLLLDGARRCSAFTLFCCIRLRDSRLGRAWVAIREDEIAAAAMGIPLMRTKTLGVRDRARSSAAWPGASTRSTRARRSRGDFSLNISIFILCMVILGGMGNVWGVMLGGCRARVPELPGAGRDRQQFNVGVRHATSTSPQYTYGIFGDRDRGDDAVRPQGLIPARDAGARARGRRARGRRSLRTSTTRRALMADDLLVATARAQGVRRSGRLQRRRLHGSARLDRQPDRPQRRRQDDVLQHADRRLHPDAGEILFDGREVAGLPPHAVTKLGVGRTFQNIRLFQTMSALENVMVGMHCRPRAASCAASCARPASGARSGRRATSARELLRYCGLADACRRGVRDEPVVRRPAPAGGGAGARDRAQAAAARRADRRHEPAGERRVHELRLAGCATSGGSRCS